MTSSYAIRRKLAEKLAVTTRLYAECAVRLATSKESGIDFVRLSKQTIEAQSLSEAACRAFMDHVGSHDCDDVAQNGKWPSTPTGDRRSVMTAKSPTVGNIDSRPRSAA